MNDEHRLCTLEDQARPPGEASLRNAASSCCAESWLCAHSSVWAPARPWFITCRIGLVLRKTWRQLCLFTSMLVAYIPAMFAATHTGSQLNLSQWVDDQIDVYTRVYWWKEILLFLWYMLKVSRYMHFVVYKDTGWSNCVRNRNASKCSSRGFSERYEYISFKLPLCIAVVCRLKCILQFLNSFQTYIQSIWWKINQT